VTTLAALQSLIAQGESETLEFKRSTAELKRAGETLCAFLNGDGGKVLIGVDPDGRLVGQKVADSTLRNIAAMLGRFEPAAHVEMHRVDVGIGLQIIVLDAPASRQHAPFVFESRPYKRVGSTTTLMPQDEHERLLIDRRHNPTHGLEDGLEDRDPRMAPVAPGGAAGAPPRARGGSDLAEHGLRARDGGSGLAESPARGATEPADATRHFETAQGRLSYAELARRLAEPLLRIDDRIRSGEFAERAMDAELLLAFHAALCAELLPEQAGRYRTVAVQVGAHEAPPPNQVAARVLEYVRNLGARLQHLPAEPDDRWLEALAYAEGELLSIHPFPDLNGRVSRLWLLELLRRMGLPPVDIVPTDADFRQRYLNALAAADRRDWQPLQVLWRERLERAAEQP
jgi:fido (protein-threonine AMPylation protein)